MIRSVLLFALLLGGAVRAQEPITIRFDELGPGPGPSTLANVLRAPHRVIPPGAAPFVLPSDSSYRRSIVVLGRDAIVAANVVGDVVVIGGDLFLRPGAEVDGRAIAIGGGVYESALERVSGEVAAYRDFTYDITPIEGGFALRYRSFREEKTPIVTWPGLLGIRLLTYDRSNGLSVPFSPRITLSPVVLEPRVSYRSQLGQFDPELKGRVELVKQVTVRARAGWNTVSNETWIWPDLSNSLATLLAGDDARNWFRAIRTDATIGRKWNVRGSSIEPFFGARWERDRNVRPDSFALGGPWSFHGRHDFDDMLRPNPRIDRGDIVSMIGGAQFDWSHEGTTAWIQLDGEFGSLSRVVHDSSSLDFAQTTWDGGIVFPTFGSQTLRFDTHALVTLSNVAPRQRWSYVGGAGSIPTIDMLSRGGDQLFFFSATYLFPIERVKIAFLGSPSIGIREIVGGADVQRFPSLAQATGIRVKLNLLYLEYLVDPSAHHGYLAAGLALHR